MKIKSWTFWINDLHCIFLSSQRKGFLCFKKIKGIHWEIHTKILVILDSERKTKLYNDLSLWVSLI